MYVWLYQDLAILVFEYFGLVLNNEINEFVAFLHLLIHNFDYVVEYIVPNLFVAALYFLCLNINQSSLLVYC